MTSLAESYKCRLYSPVYENEQKRGQNNLMETSFIDAYVQKQRQSQLLLTKKLSLFLIYSECYLNRKKSNLCSILLI